MSEIDILRAQLAASEQRAAGFESLAERMSALNGELLSVRDVLMQAGNAMADAIAAGVRELPRRGARGQIANNPAEVEASQTWKAFAESLTGWRAALAAAAPSAGSACHCGRPVVAPRDLCAACVEFDTDIKCYVGRAASTAGREEAGGE